MARGELIESHQHQDRADAEYLEEAFAAFGAEVPEGLGRVVNQDPVFYLWPENVPAWLFFRACGTQWRHGFSGPTGLDYPGVEVLMQRRRVPARRRDRLWEQVWAMEQGALLGWSERREEQLAERSRD